MQNNSARTTAAMLMMIIMQHVCLRKKFIVDSSVCSWFSAGLWGRRIQMGFFASKNFLANKADRQNYVSITLHSVMDKWALLIISQLFMYIHWRVHTQRRRRRRRRVGRSVVFTVEKLIDREWKQPVLGGYHILSQSSANSIHLKTRRICNYQMGHGR
jgi:hypothetical protein